MLLHHHLRGIDQAPHRGPERTGAAQSLLALRQVLAVGCRALVVPEQVTVPNAVEAFNDSGELKDERAAGQLKIVVRRLVDYEQMLP